MKKYIKQINNIKIYRDLSQKGTVNEFIGMSPKNKIWIHYWDLKDVEQRAKETTVFLAKQTIARLKTTLNKRKMYVKRIQRDGNRTLLFGDEREYHVIAKKNIHIRIGDMIEYEPEGLNFGWFRKKNQ
ncbi:MAG: hypothetical protein PHW62_00565 [Candidatus Ratteibacteria bacterium]|nr:hypothetical protein [Candidatus Ratteibacteria bacterium]